MSAETLEKFTPLEEEKQNIPKELTFETDYTQYGEPVDFFDKFQKEISIIHDEKLSARQILEKYHEMIDKIISEYLKPYIEDNKPAFINSQVKPKECLSAFFRALFEKIGTQKNLDQEKIQDIINVLGEVLDNHYKHREINYYFAKGEIPLKILFKPKQLQILLGDSSIPEKNRIALEDIKMPDVTNIAEWEKQQHGGFGIPITADLLDELEIRNEGIEIEGKAFAKFSYLMSKKV